MAAIPLIRQFPGVDGLERVDYIEDPLGGGSLELCFRTAEKADTFFQSFQFPGGDGFSCMNPELGLFSTTIGYTADAAGRIDLDSRIRKFSASFLNVRAGENHPTRDQLITLLKFVSGQR